MEIKEIKMEIKETVKEIKASMVTKQGDMQDTFLL